MIHSKTAILCISIILIQTISLITIVINNNSELLPGRLVKIIEYMSNYRVKNTFTGVCSGKLLVTYSAGLYTYVYLNNSYINTITLGIVNYYIVDKYFLIISIYRNKRINYVLMDCSTENVVFNKTIEYSIPVVLLNKPLSIYYDTDKIDVYISSESYSGERYTALLRHDLVNNNLDIINIFNKTIFYGNILINIDNISKTPFYKQLPTNVLIEEYSGLLNIVFENNQYVTSGLLLLDNPVKKINDMIIVEAIVENRVKLVIYSNNSFNELTIDLHYGNYALDKIYYTYSKALIIYSNTNEYLIKYIDLANYSDVLEIKTRSNTAILNTYIDFDLDNYIETIVYLNNSFYLLKTSSSELKRIYWDYLYTYVNIDTLFNTLFINNTIYLIMCFHRNSDYIVQYVKYITGVELDNTPPFIELNNPRDRAIYVGKVSIEFNVYDNESGIYLTSILLFSNSNIVFSENTTSCEYARELYLSPGTYSLRITSWNNDGVSKSIELLIYIVEYDIYIAKPQNYSYVSSIFELEIVSSFNYTLFVNIDSVLNYCFNLVYGLNKLIINVSTIPDKLIEFELLVVETNNLYRLYLFKDSNPPLLFIDSLENYTLVIYTLSFTVTVIENNPNITYIYINNTLITVFIGNGSFTYTLSSTGFQPSIYILIIESIDRANNRNRVIYIIYIGEVGDPLVTIEPEPFNNTFVPSYVVYNITCVNTSRLEIFIDNILYYSVDIDKVIYRDSVLFNTTMWSDGLYKIVFKAIGYNLKTHTLIYNWFVDNNNPFINIVVPIIGTTWRNNSFIPVRDPFLNITYIHRVQSMYCVKIYVNISDYWLHNARLYLNNTLATIYDEATGSFKTAVFNESRGYFTYITLPSEGYFILKLEAFDRAGHSSEHIIGFRIDLYPPSAFIHQPLNNTLSNNRFFNLTITVNDTVSSVVGIGLLVTYSIYKPVSLDKYTLLALVRVNHTHTIPLPEIRGSDGKYCLSILILDQGFNYILLNTYVTLDTKPPLINYNYSVVNNTLFIELEFIDETTSFSHAYLTIVNKTRVFIDTATIKYSTVLEPGLYRVVIDAWDTVGNVNRTEFTVEIKPETLIEKPESVQTNRIVDLVILVIISTTILISILIALFIKKRRAANTLPVLPSRSKS